MRVMKVASFGLALSSFFTTCWAAELCARAPDITALQVAAVRQQLMVAALSCNEIARYNDFVSAYQKELVTSDAALEAFFARNNAATAFQDYNAYKTKLANLYSRRSSGNRKGYCALAGAAFDAALGAGNRNLTAFVLGQPVIFEPTYPGCGQTVAGGATMTKASIAAGENPADAAQSEKRSALPRAIVHPLPAAKPNEAAPHPAAVAVKAPARAPHEAPIGGREANRYSNAYGERDPYYRDPYNRSSYRRLRGKIW